MNKIVIGMLILVKYHDETKFAMHTMPKNVIDSHFLTNPKLWSRLHGGNLCTAIRICSFPGVVNHFYENHYSSTTSVAATSLLVRRLPNPAAGFSVQLLRPSALAQPRPLVLQPEPPVRSASHLRTSRLAFSARRETSWPLGLLSALSPALPHQHSGKRIDSIQRLMYGTCFCTGTIEDAPMAVALE